jgi:uncharacterized membrane protein
MIVVPPAELPARGCPETSPAGKRGGVIFAPGRSAKTRDILYLVSFTLRLCACTGHAGVVALDEKARPEYSAGEISMTLSLVRLFNIVFAALVAGGMFIIWIGYDPVTFSPSTYVEQQQNAIRALNFLMPLLGGATVLLTLLAAFMQRKDRKAFVLLIVGAAFLIMSGLFTRFANQPINDIVMTWEIARPPANWTELRDQWWGFHKLRTFCGLIALVLITWASVHPRRIEK